MAQRPIAQVKTVTAFIDAVRGARRGTGATSFRGQKNEAWGISAGIFRPATSMLQHEKQAVQDMISVHPQEFQSDMTMFDRLVRMQHYGLPTRLMDLTGNPLVALYFATEEMAHFQDPADGRVTIFAVPAGRVKYYDSDAVSCVANLALLSNEERLQISRSEAADTRSFNRIAAVKRLLQFVRAEKPYFQAKLQREDLYRRHYVTPKMSNRRIVAQSGAFLTYGIEDKSSGIKRDITMQHILVDKERKAEIRIELNLLGINEISLFPELDRAASYISRRYMVPSS